MIGSVIGSFRILEQLGAGGMGVVYRARDERLRRDVAIKVLPLHALSDAASRRNFHREAVALSRLNHPAIATVHEFQTHQGTDFLVMEFVAGESLDHRLARGPLSEDEVVSLGIQLADGLAEAHRHGIVHRDLKPGNLMITPEGRLKILDFGLAKWLVPEGEDLSSVKSADSQTVAGTPAYLAPEVIEGSPADTRSDLFAVGLVLYQAATGSHPFPDLSVGAMMAAILHEKPPTLRRFNPAVSAELEAEILRCLERDPGRRYPTATALAEDLRRLQGRSKLGLPPARAAGRRTRAVAAGIAALGIAALALWRFAPPMPWSRPAAIRSLAVLPLGNLSGDPEQEYFADGMTEALITQLSHVHRLRVISLTSVMRYKGKRAPVGQIARELGVEGVVEGNIAKSRHRLRTTVHLIAALEDEQLWSGQYDGDTTDVLDLQFRVARAIVREIQVRLTPEERARLKEERRVDPAAYGDYLRGRYHWNQRTEGGIRLALEYFQHAIARDSTYALAYAGLSDAWAALGLYGLVPPPEAAARARSAAERAVALDPDLSEGHTSLAHVLHNFEWRWGEAEEEYRRAIELNPSNAVAHHFYSHLLAQQGRFDEAERTVRAAQALDPLSLSIVLASANHEYLARRYDRALEACRRAAELDSNSSLLHRLRAGILDRQGREREAVLEYVRSLELRDQREAAAALRWGYRNSGLQGALELMIAGLIRKRAAGAYEPAEHVAELYARLGRVDAAMEWLETAYREHDTELNRLKVDPLFDPLRSDARFADLLRRVGLAGASPS